MAFVGTHDPGFQRVAVLAAGLREHGLHVVQCVEPIWGSTAARVATARRGIANPELAAHLIRAYARLGRRLSALTPRPDVVIAGHPGQLDTLILTAMLPRVPLLVDAFIGLDETLADRGIGAPNSPTRQLARAVDRLAFRRADRVIVDTAAHARRYAKEYGLSPHKVVRAPVGAFDPATAITPSEAPAIQRGAEPAGGGPAATSIGGDHSDALRVLYFGGFIPLHGVPVILDAARHLGPDAGIIIELIGDGQDADLAEQRVRSEGLAHVRLRRTWMPESELVAHHLARADVCLGIFADRPKALDVVPAKLHLAIACGRAVVTADTPAVREELLACAPAEAPPVLVSAPGDGKALAAALLRLRDDPALRAALGDRGRRLYAARFTPASVVERLAQAIVELSAAR